MDLLKFGALVLSLFGIVINPQNLAPETSDPNHEEEVEVIVSDPVNPNGNYKACMGECPPDCD